jgi:hypothetical protein
MSRTHHSKLEIGARIWVVGASLYALAFALVDRFPLILATPSNYFSDTRIENAIRLLLWVAYSASLAAVAIRRSLGWVRFPIALLICCFLGFWLWGFVDLLQYKRVLGLKFLGLTVGAYGIPMVLALLLLKILRRNDEVGNHDRGASQAVIIPSPSPAGLLLLTIRPMHTWLLLIAVVFLVVCPFESVTVPKWSTRFVDAKGRPLVNLPVRQSWLNYPVEDEHRETGYTDAQGVVTFPERTLWSPLGARVDLPWHLPLAYSTYGPFTVLMPYCHDLGFFNPGIRRRRGTSLPDQIELQYVGSSEMTPSEPQCVGIEEQVKNADGAR